MSRYLGNILTYRNPLLSDITLVLKLHTRSFGIRSLYETYEFNLNQLAYLKIKDLPNYY